MSKIHEYMDEKHIDLMIITPSVNFGYLFKPFFEMRERLTCAVIEKNQDPFLITPKFEIERMKQSTNVDNIYGWNEDEDPYKKLKSQINEKINKVGLESSTRFENVLRFQKIFPDAHFLNAGEIIQKMRSIKTDAEVERLEKAGDFTVKGIQESIESLEEGITELELLKRVSENMSAYSNEPSWALVQFDENSAIPHGHASHKKLKKGSIILIDAGTSCERYFADITVTTVFGKPSDDFLKIYHIVQEANDAALEKSKEGTIAEQVDFAARKVIEDKGYGEFFTHRLGHGLGLEVHEEPYIVKGNNEKLIQGNVHTDEPGIYRLGKFGIRIEDDVLVEKDQSRRLIEFDRHFWEQ